MKPFSSSIMFLTNVIVLIILITIVRCSRIENDTKISDIPDEMIVDIQNNLMGGAENLLARCPPVNQNNVTFFLYNCKNVEEPLTISKANITQIDASKPVILLVHGWFSSAFTNGLQTLKNAYLQKYDWNVIAVDWSDLAKLSYVKSYCDLPGVSEKIADFLYEMSEKLNITLNSVRMIGHSMGAHISGLTGQHIQEKRKKKLGRITGLDPAGPIYNMLSEEQRLDETDAEFVDIMHTNAGQFGYASACGTVDFYVNCGSFQPQCPGGLTKLSLEELKKLALSVVTCHHSISWYYMAETVNANDKFQAISCAACLALMCLPNPIFPKYTVMGENTPISVREAKAQKYISIILKSALYKLT